MAESRTGQLRECILRLPPTQPPPKLSEHQQTTTPPTDPQCQKPTNTYYSRINEIATESKFPAITTKAPPAEKARFG